jgi:DNA repair exonuclease SbcCD nuclease subunit
MSSVGEDDIMLKLVHTADWHLGRQFRTFPEEQARKLSRARLEVIERVLRAADSHAVDAVLCAGDLFDDEHPDKEWWEQAAALLKKSTPSRPVFLLPGNHDPLTAESIYAKGSRFRVLLPAWVHVVDRADFTYTFPNGAVLYAVPCMSKAGQRDPTESIPKRETGDERIRIGMVHGSTFDEREWQTNFPIHRDAVLNCGLDYLAIGDTHGFRYIPPDRKHPPTIYPGAPEATAFDEKDPGCIAVVFINRRRVASVQQERVARWIWEERTVTSIDELRALVRRSDLDNRVLRLRLNMTVPAPEYDEAENLLEELQGTVARHARVGVLDLDRQGLELETSTVDQYCTELPAVLRSAVERLKTIAAEDATQRHIAERALFHLYRVSTKKAS